MKSFKEDIIQIYSSERGILAIAVINFILSLVLFIFSIVNLNPNSTVIKTGYGDIGGYRDGAWFDMLAFPVLAVVFGVLHALLAVRIFHKRGSGIAKFFLITTTMLIFGAGTVLIRLLGEG